MSYVLIVDDEPRIAKAMADMVNLFDWEATVVHGPRAAMQAIYQRPPALVLLDLNIPGVDGMEVCRFIKRDPLASSVEVVFVTAEDDPTVIEKAHQAGALDYLVKPVDFDRLEAILNRMAGH
jgi:DNA-binding response OmpR family regulator